MRPDPLKPREIASAIFAGLVLVAVAYFVTVLLLSLERPLPCPELPYELGDRPACVRQAPR